MNFFKITFLFSILLLNINLSAQNLETGVIKMEIVAVDSEDAQTAAGLEMMKGMVTEYYFSQEKSMSKTDMMGGMIKSTTLVDNSTKDLTILMDVMGNRMHVETNQEKNKMQDQGGDIMEDLKISYDESDSKSILGYNCIKATVEGMSTDGPTGDMAFIMYVTDEIKASNQMIQGMDKIELKGFPLQYVLENDLMSMTYEAVEINKDLDKAVFDVKTAGYTKMTMEEFMEQMGSMSGGMGF